jgi:SAM-dependent methyltransferase
VTATAALGGTAEPDSRPFYPAAALVAELLEACAAGAAVGSAIDLGVVARLQAGPVAQDSVAADCGLTRQGAESLLAALAALGLVTREDDGRFRPAFSRLTDLVGQLALLFRESAEHAAGLLTQPSARVLDIGAGAAPWSLALAARDPDTRIRAVELPAVLPATRRAVAAAGYAAQFDHLGGDLFAVNLGRSVYDLAIAGNLCHLFDEATNRRLLRRVFHAVRPGGAVAILEGLPTERFDGPRPVILSALGLLLRTDRGQLYPFSTYVGWLREAGFEAVERIDLSVAPPLSLIAARRPA